MKMEDVKRKRCTCDFCGKRNWSPGHMRKHELHCTMNPDRECRVCKMVEGEQKPIAELMAVLPPTPTRADDEYGYSMIVGLTEEQVNATIPALRAVCGACPACMMAALRQRGIPVPMATVYSFKADMASLWSDIYESRRDQY